MQDEPKTQENCTAQDAQEIIKDGKANPHKITGLGSDEKRAARLEKLRAALDPNSPDYDAKTAETFAKIWQFMQAAADKYMPIWQEVAQLLPFLKQVITAPEYNGLTLDEIVDAGEDPDTGRPIPGSIWDLALNEARTLFEHDAAQTTPLMKVSYKQGTELKTSTDKLGNLFYSLSAPTNKHVLDGQREILSIPREELTELKYESDADKKQITLFYDFLPNESQLQKIGLTSKFDSYDFFISAVTDNLYLNGNSTVSLSKIWHELGNTTSPNTTQLTELYKRLVRGATTIVTIDDSEVQKAWKKDTAKTYKEIISPVMPLQILGEKFVSNGNIASARINITGLSPFFALSQSIGHYTTWKKEVLQLYTGRKTSRYYSIMQFLMSQIAWIRNPNSKRSNKITYQSVYDYIGDNSTRGKQLSRDMIYRLLDEVFIPAKYIKSYKEDNHGEPGVKINCVPVLSALPPAKKPTKPKKQ